MLKYRNKGETICVDLNNGYEVYAFYHYSKVKECYIVTLYLKDYQIDMLDLMEQYENIEIHSKKPIKLAIANYSLEKYKDGEFNKYITRYEYEQDCLDYGVDHID